MIARPPARFFLADAVHRFRAPFTPTLISLLVLAGATIAIFATTGIALATQQATLDRINSPQGRLITVADTEGDAGFSSESVEVIAGLSGVDWVFAVGPALDASAKAIPGGQTVPARLYYGRLPPVLTVATATDAMAPGMALAGPGVAATLGLKDGLGTVEAPGRSGTVVGRFTPGAPLNELGADVLIAPQGEGRILTLWVEVQDVSQLAVVESGVRASVIAAHPGALHVDTSIELTQLSADITAELAKSATLTVSALLAAVFVLVGAVEYARVASTTRDIGRRRALGATRSAIVLGVLATAGLSALVGTLIGVMVGAIVTFVSAGTAPRWVFCVGIVILMVIAALAGAVAPALRASRLDPVAILRVP